MTARVRKSPQALRDLIEIYSFIARDKVQPAERFPVVAEHAFVRLAVFPFMGRSWESSLPHLADVRVYPLPGAFRNYLVFYRPFENGVEVMSVQHGGRDLQYVLPSLYPAP